MVRSGSTVGRTAVSFATSNSGSEDPGPDFVPTGGVLVFPDGVATATFSVSLLDDAVDELDTHFGVNVNEVVGGAPVVPGQDWSLVYLLDDDAPDAAPTIAITSPTSSPAFAHQSRLLTLAGTASDASGITRVTWSNDRATPSFSLTPLRLGPPAGRRRTSRWSQARTSLPSERSTERATAASRS